MEGPYSTPCLSDHGCLLPSARFLETEQKVLIVESRQNEVQQHPHYFDDVTEDVSQSRNTQISE